MGQTTVQTDFSVGTPAGAIADDSLKVVDSKFNQEASAGVPFGVFVKVGTVDDAIKLLAANTDKLEGITVWGQSYARSFELDTDGNVKPKSLLGVMRVGRVNVYPEDAVTPSSGVHTRAVATGSEVKGALRGTKDGTDTIDCSSFCRWITSGDSDSPAVLEIDIRNAGLQAADS